LPIQALNPRFTNGLSANLITKVVIRVLFSLATLIALLSPMLNLNVMQLQRWLERHVAPQVAPAPIPRVAVVVVRASNLKAPHSAVKQPKWLLVLAYLDDLRITAIANHYFSHVQVGFLQAATKINGLRYKAVSVKNPQPIVLSGDLLSKPKHQAAFLNLIATKR
jgi:hypothetical protein